MSKIVILGAGHVGSLCALSLGYKGVASEIVLIDILEEKAASQAKDVEDAMMFVSRVPVVKAGDYSDCDDADIIINAVGVSRKPGQTRLDLLDVTIDIMKDVVDKIAKTKFAGIFISISNPCDIVADYARRMLNLPKNRIFGTGTSLDTARLRLTLHKLTGMSPASIQCFALGEHGDSSISPISCVAIQGKPLREWMEERPETFGKITVEQLEERTHNLGMEIVIGKGSTEFGIGAATADLCKAVLYDEKKVFPVSALLEGEYGESGLMAGVPAIIGKDGMEGVVEMHLTEEEQAGFHRSCDVIRNYISMIH